MPHYPQAPLDGNTAEALVPHPSIAGTVYAGIRGSGVFLASARSSPTRTERPRRRSPTSPRSRPATPGTRPRGL